MGRSNIWMRLIFAAIITGQFVLGQDLVCNESNREKACKDNSECIYTYWFCDGEADCADGSDEELNYCQNEHQCDPDEFRCDANFAAAKFPACFYEGAVCDNTNDCIDGADEKVCPCGEGEEKCNDGGCVLTDHICDRIRDCDDWSDESPFKDCSYIHCTSEQFTCDNGLCIATEAKCNGIRDCSDGSDEKPESCETNQCKSTEFTCADGSCIDALKACNQSPDCPDSSDESPIAPCSVNECSEARYNNCSDTCTNLNPGFKCECDDGRELTSDQATCQDINECVQSPLPCSQICTDTQGSFSCMCAADYVPSSSSSGIENAVCSYSKHCVTGEDIAADGDNGAHLLIANEYYLRKANFAGTENTLLLDDSEHLSGLSIDTVEGYIYFVDNGLKTLKRMKYPEGSVPELVNTKDVSVIQGLAVDWIGRKLYWTDKSLSSVLVSEMNGTHVKVLYDNSDYCRGIAVYPQKGWLYWTDWDYDPFIARMGMDGSDMKKIVTTGIFWPNTVVVDPYGERIYWGDAFMNQIEYSDLDGNNRYTFSLKVPHIYGMTIFEDKMIWADWNTLTIEMANRFTGDDRKLVQTFIKKPYTIQVYCKGLQPQSPNPCGTNNGGCSHLCLIAPGGTSYTCACPEHFSLQDDGKTCNAECNGAQYECDPLTDHRCIPLTDVCNGVTDCLGGDDEPNTCGPIRCNRYEIDCQDSAGTCIRATDLCDLYQDCPNNFDENNSTCTNRECLPGEFLCKTTGRCIPPLWECDEEEDCDDGSDEAPLNAKCLQPTCKDSEFQCNNSVCIDATWVCDYDNDCGDWSDEPRETCVHNTCESGWVKCCTNYRCIPSFFINDGYDDCRDNSDENGCLTPDPCDPDGDFTCGNGYCIPLRWTCDGENDCLDGSDETLDRCVDSKCTESQFACGDGQCIKGSYKCDHNPDCDNAKDEEPVACADNFCDPESEFKCNSGHCVPKSYQCDREADCPDGSDESNCPALPCIIAGDFMCNNTVCIPQAWVCDVYDDCKDNSDETIQLCLNIPCDEPERFRCENGRCLFRYQLCDGVDQCGDGSDENDFTICDPSSKDFCQTGEYRCSNGNCIPHYKLCNMEDDCGDNTDEKGCIKELAGGCVNATAAALLGVDEWNGGCQGLCTDVQNKVYHTCHCPEGMVIDNDDARKCLDINECEAYELNNCPQVCDDRKPGYACKCLAGFSMVELASDKDIKCEPSLDKEQIIMYSIDNSIRQFFYNERVISDAALYGGKVTLFELDLKDKRLFWVDTTNNRIMRGGLPIKPGQVSMPQIIHLLTSEEQLYGIKGLAYDWLGKNLYYSTKGTIRLMSDDGRFKKTIISGGSTTPSSLAVFPQKGMLYWTDEEMRAIRSSKLDGSDPKLISNNLMEQPMSIVIDYNKDDGRLFWCDMKKNTIETMKLDGTDRYTVLQDVGNPYSMDIAHSNIFFVNNSGVYKSDKFGRGVVGNIASTPNVVPHTIRINELLKYDVAAPSLCDSLKCSPLCVSGLGGAASCTCQDGGSLISSTACDISGASAPIPSAQICSCLNGGYCTYTSTQMPRCKCPDGFSGTSCETVVTTPKTTTTTTTSKATKPTTQSSTKSGNSVDTSTVTARPGGTSKPLEGGSGGTSVAAVVIPILLVFLVVIVIIFIVFILYRRGVIGKQVQGRFRRGPAGATTLENSPYEEPTSVGYSNEGPTQFDNPVYLNTMEVKNNNGEITLEPLPENKEISA